MVQQGITGTCSDVVAVRLTLGFLLMGALKHTPDLTAHFVQIRHDENLITNSSTRSLFSLSTLEPKCLQWLRIDLEIATSDPHSQAPEVIPDRDAHAPELNFPEDSPEPNEKGPLSNVGSKLCQGRPRCFH